MTSVVLSVNHHQLKLSTSALEEIKGIVSASIIFLESQDCVDQEVQHLTDWFNKYLLVYGGCSSDTDPASDLGAQRHVYSERELIEFWAMFNGLWPVFLKTGLEGVYLFVLTFRTIDETKINQYNVHNWSVFNSIAHSLELIIPYCKSQPVIGLYTMLRACNLKHSRILLRCAGEHIV
jgi:hypothetical protein